MSKKRKLKTWKVKNMDEKKEYKTILGHTDYDIPMFGYRSAFLSISLIFLSLVVSYFISYLFLLDYRYCVLIISSLTSGASFAFSQFFIETKRGLCKEFYIIFILLSLISFVVIYFLVFKYRF